MVADINWHTHYDTDRLPGTVVLVEHEIVGIRPHPVDENHLVDRRLEHEESREAAEIVRRAAEELRTASEAMRRAVEHARAFAEDTRLFHEQARQAAEEAQRDAEEWRTALAEQRETKAEMNETLRAWKTVIEQQQNGDQPLPLPREPA